MVGPVPPAVNRVPWPVGNRPYLIAKVSPQAGTGVNRAQIIVHLAELSRRQLDDVDFEAQDGAPAFGKETPSMGTTSFAARLSKTFMNALVTGGGGFLGRYIVEQLVARGDRVRTFSRSRYGELDELGVEQISGEISDADAVSGACQGIDTVFHTAAIAGIWGPWEPYYLTNYVGTQNVLRGCREQGVSRLVYSSSPSVTFDGSDQRGVDESAPYATRWLANYPRSKAMAEIEVLAANEPGGLRTCALRPHLIWGPRDRHLIPRLLDRARSGKLRRVGDGTNLIDIVYVENAATAHLQAADALGSNEPAPAGRAYFISQGEPVNCWDWINQILALAGIQPVSKPISFRAASAAGTLLESVYWLTGRWTEPRMTRFLAAQLAKSHYFDISRSRQDFGYDPQISTAEGMRRLANWCGTG